MRTCEVEGCLSEKSGKWVCSYHRKQIKRGSLLGEPEWGIALNPPCAVSECPRLSSTSKPSSSGLCHVHAIQKSGKGVGAYRAKRASWQPARECSIEDCKEGSVALKMCQAHYLESRRVAPRSCAHDDCTVRPRVDKDRCKRHDAQMQKYGITWGGVRPTEELRRIREEGRAKCGVKECERKVSSDSSELCREHVSDRARRGISVEKYLSLLAITSCESCGSESGRMCFDHDHSCCSNGGRMCDSCIRGRICADCNSALGMLSDSAERVRKLLAYISRFE